VVDLGAEFEGKGGEGNAVVELGGGNVGAWGAGVVHVAKVSG
jgi:hypothetical protein